MLFNSYEFIFLLLPIAVLGYRLLKAQDSLRTGWLLACSLFFYGYWNPTYLILLLGSIAWNFLLGRQLAARPRRWLLVLGIAANLASIAYFKYAAFLVDNWNTLAGTQLDVGTIALPLAISFFTFQQIAFLVDCYRGEGMARHPLQYALFVSFFPQLIAGPIVHHSEVMPQFAKRRSGFTSDLTVGITIFVLGLFKKTVLADGIAPFANALFDDPQAWHQPTLLHAWIGVLAYGFQIYFDFSGYSDMAIGAARMFGILLPLNFYSPYRAMSISDFWRRWHMTLSRFLRDYLYIPLGGNRFGTAQRYRNLMLTMLLGGLWHGAGWTFVLWGLLHGLYLVIQHGWSRISRNANPIKASPVYRMAACLLTFAAVHVAWVYFRAESLACANHVLLGMCGWNGVSLPSAIGNRLDFDFGNLGIRLDDASGSEFVLATAWILACFAIVWGMPTTQQFVGRFQPAFDYSAQVAKEDLVSGFGWRLPVSWRPSFRFALVTSLLATTGILSLLEVSEFLYFQF